MHDFQRRLRRMVTAIRRDDTHLILAWLRRVKSTAVDESLRARLVSR